VAVVSYYVYVILGLDADTFSLEGGTDFYRKAQSIVTQAQGSNYSGWTQTTDRSRFELVDNLLSNTYKEYRVAMYNYHRKGLDILADNNSTGKQIIAGTMNLFQTMINRRPNAFLIQTFFDAKSEEIQNIFSDGPKVDIVKLKETLNKIAPLYSSTWNEIKY
jgi:glycosylphosphatidylinositol transamidase (GPIT) subunit GPI8